MLPFDQSTYVPDVEIARIHGALRKFYGIVKAKLTPFTGYEDKNYLLDDIEYDGRDGPTNLVLKISNPLEAATSGHLEFQVRLADVLIDHSIPAPKTFPLLDGSRIAMVEVAAEVFLPIRLFYLLPGSILEDYEFTTELVQTIGALLARFHKILDESKYFNETNLLLSNGQITGLLDLGDAHVSLRAMDIASLILYLQLSDRLQQGVSFLAENVLSGYRSVRPITSSDEAILVCMRARISCSLIYGLRTARMRGDGSDGYVLKTQKPGWLILEKLLARERLVNLGT